MEWDSHKRWLKRALGMYAINLDVLIIDTSEWLYSTQRLLLREGVTRKGKRTETSMSSSWRAKGRPNAIEMTLRHIISVARIAQVADENHLPIHHINREEDTLASLLHISGHTDVCRGCMQSHSQCQPSCNANQKPGIYIHVRAALRFLNPILPTWT